MVTLWCGFMNQSCNCTVLAATLSYFTFLCDVNKVTTQLCPYARFPKVLQSLVWASCIPPCPSQYWCVSEQGKAAVDCIVDVVLISVLSLLSPEGSLS